MPFIQQESIDFQELKRYTVHMRKGGSLNTDRLDGIETVGSGCIKSIFDHHNQTVSYDGINWRDVVRTR